MNDVTSDRSVALASGETLELYEPAHSGQGAMQDGRCPGCQQQLRGFVGRCAAIRVLDADGQPVMSTLTTRYGHLECVEGLFIQRRTSVRIVDNDDDDDEVTGSTSWRSGTQRQLLDYLQAHGTVDHVKFDVDGPRWRRYRWRTS